MISYWNQVELVRGCLINSCCTQAARWRQPHLCQPVWWATPTWLNCMSSSASLSSAHPADPSYMMGLIQDIQYSGSYDRHPCSAYPSVQYRLQPIADPCSRALTPPDTSIQAVLILLLMLPKAQPDTEPHHSCMRKCWLEAW
jgi:hypothetical protein